MLSVTGCFGTNSHVYQFKISFLPSVFTVLISILIGIMSKCVKLLYTTIVYKVMTLIFMQ
jgi:hypothetical protein